MTGEAPDNRIQQTAGAQRLEEDGSAVCCARVEHGEHKSSALELPFGP